MKNTIAYSLRWTVYEWSTSWLRQTMEILSNATRNARWVKQRHLLSDEKLLFVWRLVAPLVIDHFHQPIRAKERNARSHSHTLSTSLRLLCATSDNSVQMRMNGISPIENFSCKRSELRIVSWEVSISLKLLPKVAFCESFVCLSLRFGSWSKRISSSIEETICKELDESLSSFLDIWSLTCPVHFAANHWFLHWNSSFRSTSFCRYVDDFLAD